MSHCPRHAYYHADCDACRRQRGQRDTSSPLDSSPSDSFNTAITPLDIPAPSMDISGGGADTPADSGFADSTDSGGDFGGGGSGGDW